MPEQATDAPLVRGLKRAYRAVLAPVIALVGVVMLALASARMLKTLRRRRRRRKYQPKATWSR